MENVYIHDPTQAYPVIDTQHMVLREKKHDYVYDKDFMYRLHGFPYNIYKILMKTFLLVLAQPVCLFRYALKIRGRENMKKYKALAGKKGMITVCNHTTEWDSIFVSCSRFFRFAEFPIWQEGAECSSGILYRLAGGIVMPKASPRGIVYSYKCMDDVIKEGKWLHVFPEAACWPFFPAIREFKTGTFRIAVEHNMPVLPMAVKYRANRGIYKLFKKQPNAELLIGEPVMPDPALPKKDAIDDMTRRTRESVMKLLGIESEEQNAAIRALFGSY